MNRAYSLACPASMQVFIDYGRTIDQFRYIKIQPKTIDLSTRLVGINRVCGNRINRVCGVYSQEPRTEVYCFRLNFNISKLVYWTPNVLNLNDVFLSLPYLDTKFYSLHQSCAKEKSSWVENARRTHLRNEHANIIDGITGYHFLKIHLRRIKGL